MLESGMRSTRVDHEGSCKLVNMSEPLDRWRVNKLPFAGSQSDESMNSIPDLMVFFRHCGTVRYGYRTIGPASDPLVLNVSRRIRIGPGSYGVLTSNAPIASHGCELTSTLILEQPFRVSERVLLSVMCAGCAVSVVAFIDPFDSTPEYSAILRLTHVSLLCNAME